MERSFLASSSFSSLMSSFAYIYVISLILGSSFYSDDAAPAILNSHFPISFNWNIYLKKRFWNKNKKSSLLFVKRARVLLYKNQFWWSRNGPRSATPSPVNKTDKHLYKVAFV